MMKMPKRDPRRAQTVLKPCGNAFSAQKPIWEPIWTILDDLGIRRLVLSLIYPIFCVFIVFWAPFSYKLQFFMHFFQKTTIFLHLYTFWTIDCIKTSCDTKISLI